MKLRGPGCWGHHGAIPGLSPQGTARLRAPSLEVGTTRVCGQPAAMTARVKERQANILYWAWGWASAVYTDLDPCPPLLVLFPKDSWPWGQYLLAPGEEDDLPDK